MRLFYHFIILPFVLATIYYFVFISFYDLIELAPPVLSVLFLTRLDLPVHFVLIFLLNGK